ncbi:MAG: hypothetical protein FD123_4152 [Bacteroidetes bacterium]|nr:MAG: hypothetical protein FD123_4152 [Bacteroidota bacterium]
MYRAFTVSLIFLLFLTTCKKDPVQPGLPEHSQKYSVCLNVTTMQTESRADFGYPTNKTALGSGYWITCNGVNCAMQTGNPPLTPSTGPSYYYTCTQSGFVDAHFKFRKPDGSIFENLVDHTEISLIDFSVNPGSVSVTDTIIIPFTGGPRLSNESISVSIFQSTSHFSYGYQPVSIGDTVIKLFPSNMTYLIPGSATITLMRRGPSHALDQADGNAGGSKQLSTKAVRSITVTN